MKRQPMDPSPRCDPEDGRPRTPPRASESAPVCPQLAHSDSQGASAFSPGIGPACAFLALWVFAMTLVALMTSISRQRAALEAACEFAEIRVETSGPPPPLGTLPASGAFMTHPGALPTVSVRSAVTEAQVGSQACSRDSRQDE